MIQTPIQEQTFGKSPMGRFATLEPSLEADAYRRRIEGRQSLSLGWIAQFICDLQTLQVAADCGGGQEASALLEADSGVGVRD